MIGKGDRKKKRVHQASLKWPFVWCQEHPVGSIFFPSVSLWSKARTYDINVQLIDRK